MLKYFKIIYKNNKFKILLITILLISLSSPMIFTIYRNSNHHRLENKFPVSSDYWILTGIHIDNNWSLTESIYDWCIGSGTIGDPYTIENITIDAQGRSGIMVENTIEYFRIQNCTINNTGSWNGAGGYYEAGIRLSHADNGIIYNNTIYDTDFAAISLDYAENHNISDNNLYQNQLWGLSILFSETIDVKNNSLNANFADMGIQRSEYITMNDNRLLQKGIRFRADFIQEIVSHDIDQSNTVNGKVIYYYKNMNNLVPINFSDAGQVILANCKYSHISNLSLSSFISGIELFYSDYNVIEWNNFTSFGDLSIKLHRSSNNTLQYNRFTAGDGIDMSYANDNDILFNHFSDSLHSIQIAGYCERNNISYNEIDEASYSIYLATAASNNKIFYNNITNSGLYAIRLWRYCDLNEIYENNIEENDQYGVILENDCDTNIIRNNKIRDNLDGIYLETGCDLNGIYNNTFQLNGLHAHDDGVDNYWNLTNTGNYWDNYTGSDQNDDNIGDSPYVISGSALSADYAPIWNDGDDLSPNINILNPTAYSYYNEPPVIELNITDAGGVNTTWYTIIGSGENYTFGSASFEINMSAWLNLAQGIFTVRVFANDTTGNLEYAEIDLIKDTINPFLMINSPLSGAEFGSTPPNINLTVTEVNLFQLWFTINDSSTLNYVAGSSGENTFSIESSIWNLIPEGHVLITFFANDTLGQTGTISITIIKEIPEEPPEPPSIPGFNVFIILFFSLFSVILLSRMKTNKNK